MAPNTPSKRLWAIAAFSRFVRPGAVRVTATSSNDDVKVSAFVNANGGTVVNLLHTATRPAQVTLRSSQPGVHLVGGLYVTDETRSLAAVPVVDSDGPSPVVRLDARSLTTVVGTVHSAAAHSRSGSSR